MRLSTKESDRRSMVAKTLTGWLEKECAGYFCSVKAVGKPYACVQALRVQTLGGLNIYYQEMLSNQNGFFFDLSNSKHQC